MWFNVDDSLPVPSICILGIYKIYTQDVYKINIHGHNSETYNNKRWNKSITKWELIARALQYT